jgi:hypothetical protein
MPVTDIDLAGVESSQAYKSVSYRGDSKDDGSTTRTWLVGSQCQRAELRFPRWQHPSVSVIPIVANNFYLQLRAMYWYDVIARHRH